MVSANSHQGRASELRKILDERETELRAFDLVQRQSNLGALNQIIDTVELAWHAGADVVGPGMVNKILLTRKDELTDKLINVSSLCSQIGQGCINKEAKSLTVQEVLCSPLIRKNLDRTQEREKPATERSCEESKQQRKQADADKIVNAINLIAEDQAHRFTMMFGQMQLELSKLNQKIVGQQSQMQCLAEPDEASQPQGDQTLEQQLLEQQQYYLDDISQLKEAAALRDQQYLSERQAMQSNLNRVIVERDKALNNIMKLQREKAMVIKAKDTENARLKAQIAELK